MTNYRPIAILSVPAKLFESIIYNVVYNTAKNTISIHQHGFIADRSTTSNLINMIQDITRALNERAQMDAIHTDFA